MSPGRALVFDKVGQAKDWNWYRLQRILNAIGPRLVERQAGHAGKKIDAIWRKTKLDDDVVAREILLSNIQVIKQSTELRKCAPHPSRILFGRIDPDVDVDR